MSGFPCDISNEESISEPESTNEEPVCVVSENVVPEEEFTPEQLQKIKDGKPVFMRDSTKDVYGETNIPKEEL